MATIQTADNLRPKKTNTTLDARCRVETESDIANITLPAVGLLVYVKDTKKVFKITALNTDEDKATAWEEAGVTDAKDLVYNPEGKKPAGSVAEALFNVGDIKTLHKETIAAKEAAVAAKESTDNTIGIAGLSDFDESERYILDDCFKYNNKMYKVVNPRGHRGPFGDGSDFKETSLYGEAAERILSNGTENCIVHLLDNQGNPMVGVRVEVNVLGKPDGRGGYVGGETAPRVQNTNDAGIARFNYIDTGNDYEISAAVVEGYANPSDQARTSALTERHVYITYSPAADDMERVYLTFKYENSEEILDRAESVHVEFFYADGTKEGKDLRIVDGDTLSFEVLKGTNYTIVFPHVGDYTTPPMIQWNAHRAERSHIVYYYLSTSGLSWLMTDGSERNLNSVFPSDADNVVGLIIDNPTIMGQDRRFVLPKETCSAVSGLIIANKNFDIPILPKCNTVELALSDKDGEFNTKEIEKAIAEQEATSTAISYVRSIQYTINGELYKACIASAAQLYAVAINEDVIYDAFLNQLSLAFVKIASSGDYPYGEDLCMSSTKQNKWNSNYAWVAVNRKGIIIGINYGSETLTNTRNSRVLPIIDYKSHDED